MNGAIDVGISVGTDLGLQEADRLQVHSSAGSDDDTSKMLTLCQVITTKSLINPYATLTSSGLTDHSR